MSAAPEQGVQLGVQRRAAGNPEARPQLQPSVTHRRAQLDDDVGFAGKAGQQVLELAQGRHGGARWRRGAGAARWGSGRAWPPGPAASRTSSSVGSKRSTCWAMRHVLSRSLWSTLPRTSTMESVASASSQAASALPKTMISTEDSRSYERGEHHPVALLGLDLLGLRHHPADRHPVAVAAGGELGEGAVGLGPQRRPDVLERVGRDEQSERLLLGGQQLGAVELLARDRRVAGAGEDVAAAPWTRRPRHRRGRSRGRRSSPGR